MLGRCTTSVYHLTLLARTEPSRALGSAPMAGNPGLTAIAMGFEHQATQNSDVELATPATQQPSSTQPRGERLIPLWTDDRDRPSGTYLTTLKAGGPWLTIDVLRGSPDRCCGFA